MKILILGMLGSGKSTLAYNINKKYGLPRLNLDEICRDKNTGTYYTPEQQEKALSDFVANNPDWVIEGIHKNLYQKLNPDIIVYLKISRIKAAWRFTMRFCQAKKLIGKQIDPDLPVQAYHYRRPTPCKIYDWDQCNKNIKKECEEFISGKPNCLIIENKSGLQSFYAYLNTKMCHTSAWHWYPGSKYSYIVDLDPSVGALGWQEEELSLTRIYPKAELVFIIIL